MKKSTIITVLAFTLGIVVLAAGFILLTDNNISNSLFATTTTGTTTTPTTTRPVPDDVPMDLFSEDISKYITFSYTDFVIEVENMEAAEELIDLTIDQLLCFEKKYTEVNEGSVTDKVIFSFDYKGHHTNEDGTKGEAFDKGAGEYQLAYVDGDTLYVLVSDSTNGNYISTFIDGFAQGLRDKKPGDEFELEITFPEDYGEATLKGKKTIFDIKINYLTQTNLTDGWVKEYSKGKYNTCDEYREYIRKTINDSYKNTNLNLLWAKIEESVVVKEIPKQQFDYYYNNQRYTIETYAEQYGMTYESFLSFGGAAYLMGLNVYSDDDLIKSINDSIKSELVMAAICQAEGIEATDEEYELMIESFSEQYSMTKEQLIAAVGEEYFRTQVKYEKIDDVIYELNEFVLKTQE